MLGESLTDVAAIKALIDSDAMSGMTMAESFEALKEQGYCEEAIRKAMVRSLYAKTHPEIVAALEMFSG